MTSRSSFKNWDEDLQALGRQLHELKKPMLKSWCKKVGVPVGRTKKDMVENLIRSVKTWEIRLFYDDVTGKIEIAWRLGYGG